MKNILVCQHEPGKDLRLFEPLLKSLGVSAQYADFHKSPDSRPGLSGHDALIVMGGAANVHEAPQRPHVLHEMRLIQQAADENIPVLGVCLGGQLVAKALGGEVTRSPRPEIGWYPLELTTAGREDPCFADQDKPRVLQWHEYEFSLPRGAILLASSRLCRNQAFRLGSRILATQFHFEVDGAMIEQWLDASSLKRTPRAAAIRAETRRMLPASKQFGGRILEEFLSLL
ncbi:MAG: type 1 glutamine amidotransferase [Elusimicrobiota bacterium]